MRWIFLLCLFVASVTAASAQTLVATGTIRSMTVIAPGDVTLADGVTPGAISDPVDAIGLEARVNLYPGRPIFAADLRPPAVVQRNEIITLRYNRHGLLIVTEGRALDRAGIGEAVRVMNLASRTIVTATISQPGLAEVGIRY